MTISLFFSIVFKSGGNQVNLRCENLLEVKEILSHVDNALGSLEIHVYQTKYILNTTTHLLSVNSVELTS